MMVGLKFKNVYLGRTYKCFLFPRHCNIPVKITIKLLDQVNEAWLAHNSIVLSVVV